MQKRLQCTGRSHDAERTVYRSGDCFTLCRNHSNLLSRLRSDPIRTSGIRRRCRQYIHQVSCHLGIPRVVYSQEIYAKDQILYARKYISSSKEAVYRLKSPVLIQSIHEQGVTRQPKIADIIRTYQDMTIQYLDGNAIAAGLSSAKTGLHLIRKTEPPKDKSTSMTLLKGLSDDESAANLLRILREKGFQGRRKR